LILQLIINKYLALDPDLEMRLTPLAGKVLAITCTDYSNWQLYCTFTSQSLLFTSSVPQHIDVKVYSSFSGFVKFAVTQDKTEIMLEGNIHAAESALKFFSDLNIDWEEELSKYSGDVIAHQAGVLMAKLKQYHAHTSNSLEAMITEYLQEESGLLPTNFEVNEFIDAVDQLRLDADRLNAKVTVYENN
jgi:ubiquinone biosynthesis protein UbiJ